jgi:hypothetical protein
MAIGDDFSIAANGDIRHVSGTATYRVLEMHVWLQSLADDKESSGNDFLAITDETPSERSTDNIITFINGFNIDDTAAEFLYDGSITQDGGDTIYYGLVVVGSTYGTTTLQVVQDNALYDTDAPFWGTGINADASRSILSRMLIKGRSGGSDIDGSRIRVYAREWGATFAEFGVALALGNNTAAIFTNEDLNNQTASATVAGWSTISNTEGYQTIDLNNGNGAKPYYSQWNRDTYSINQLYERAKYLTMRGTSQTLYGMDGELFRGITHEWDYDAEASGPFSENEVLSWGSGSTAGTGALIALYDAGTTGTQWIQLLTGVVPTDGATITGGTSSATCTVDGTVTARTLPSVFLGQSTGTSLIGGFGVGVEAADLTNNDKVFDLTNTQQQPPNNVTFTMYGLVSGEDYALVTNDDSGAPDKTQMTLSTALTGTTTSIVVNAIPVDTPQTGSLRVVLDVGRDRYIDYTSWTGSTFTTASTSWADPNDAASGNGVYLGYIDKLATASTATFTLTYNADRTLFGRVRDGGATPIKTFESTGTLGSGGGSMTVIRTSDA